MNAPGRIGLFVAGAVVAFAVSYGAAALIVPDSVAVPADDGTHEDGPHDR